MRPAVSRSLVLKLPILLPLLAMLALPAFAGKDPWVDGDKLEFALHDLDGNQVDSNDRRFEGKVLLVDLWGTWCPPCISEISTFKEFHAKYGERGLVIVAIAFEGDEDPDSRRAYLRKFVEDNHIRYMVLDGGTPDLFEFALPGVQGVGGFPVEILVDRTGAVFDTRNSYGYKKKWVKKLTRDVEALLSD